MHPTGPGMAAALGGEGADQVAFYVGRSPEDGEHQAVGTVAGVALLLVVAHGSGSERTAPKTHCA